jgi:hypothetical protein
MAKHFNPTISSDVQRIFNFKQGDTIPADVGNMLVPTIPIERYCNIVKSGTNSNATSTTIYTTPSDKDFYLTAFSMSLIKDVNAAGVAFSLKIYVDAVQIAVLTISSLTLTVHSSQLNMALKYPIKVDKGTIISLTSNSAVGNFIQACNIIGYTVETIN